MATSENSFKTTPAERQVIFAIATRAGHIIKEHKLRLAMSDVAMDIIACHCNGCPLRLDDLLAADDTNFIHDVFGINRHLDRKTGALKDCFYPRFHAREVA